MIEVLERLGKTNDVERVCLDTLAAVRREFTNDAPALEGYLSLGADALLRMGKFAEAEPVCRELLESRTRRLPSGDPAIERAADRLARSRRLPMSKAAD